MGCKQASLITLQLFIQKSNYRTLNKYKFNSVTKIIFKSLMPVLYCRPANNLANRMMSIVSAHRLARLWSYDFCLIWDWGPETLFANSYEELFECNHKVSRDFSLNAHELHIPERSSNGRHFYYKPLSEKDVLLDGWGHLTLSDQDRGRTAEEITLDLQLELRNLFVPSVKVRECCKNLGYLDQAFEFGIHIRRGAPEFDSISENEKLLVLAQKIIKEGNYKSFFIASTDNATADFFGEKLSSYGNCFVSRGFNNEPCFRNHALAIYDLIFLSRCREIMKTGATTYSSLAGLLGSSVVFNTINEQGSCIKHPAMYSVGYGL